MTSAAARANASSFELRFVFSHTSAVSDGGRSRIGIAVGWTIAPAACHVGFRRTLGIGQGGSRLAAALVSVVTIPLGTEIAAAAQVGALAAIVAGGLALSAM
jgi:hypothetical protein